jgi:hypothetical protein
MVRENRKLLAGAEELSKTAETVVQPELALSRGKKKKQNNRKQRAMTI